MRMGDEMGMAPGVSHMGDNGVHPEAVPDLRKDKRPVAPHGPRVAFHYAQVRPHGGGKVGFVNDQQVGLGNARTALAGDFIAAGDVDDVNGVVGEFAAEMGGEVVPTGFNQQQIGLEGAVKLLEGQEICGNVFADGGVGAAAGLYRPDAPGGQGLVADEELRVFLGKDIVGDGRHDQLIAKPLAKGKHERGFSAAHGSADAHGERAVFKIALEGQVALVEMTRGVEGVVGVRVGMAARRAGHV